MGELDDFRFRGNGECFMFLGDWAILAFAGGIPSFIRCRSHPPPSHIPPPHSLLSPYPLSLHSSLSPIPPSLPIPAKAGISRCLMRGGQRPRRIAEKKSGREFGRKPRKTAKNRKKSHLIANWAKKYLNFFCKKGAIGEFFGIMADVGGEVLCRPADF